MEAKDTVMDAKQVLNLLEKSNRHYRKYLKENPPRDKMGEILTRITRRALQVHYATEAQAEISFKAGYEQGIKNLRLIGTVHKYSPTAKKAYRAGIREVVEWIRGCGIYSYGDELCGFEIDVDEWQAKLKEWRIK